MSAGVEIIGIDSILSLIQSYDFTAIKLTHGEKSPENKFNMTVSEDYGQDDIVAEFDKRFRNYPTTNFSKYALNITYLLKNNKSTNLTYQVSFYTNQSNSAISKSTTDKGSGKESNELSFNIGKQVGELEAENRNLQQQIASYQEEDGEESVAGLPWQERLMDALLPHTPSIISGIMTLLNNKNQPISVAGVPGDVQHLINEMMQIEPEFPEHLSLLINLRKNKPAVYNIALNQLKSL